MTLIIDIPDEDYDKIKDNSPDAFNYLTSWRLYDAIKNGIPLSDNPTNGDMIKAMFPNAIIEIMKSCVEKNMVCVTWGFKEIPSYYNRFYEDWWNAPYKGGE